MLTYHRDPVHNNIPSRGVWIDSDNWPKVQDIIGTPEAVHCKAYSRRTVAAQRVGKPHAGEAKLAQSTVAPYLVVKCIIHSPMNTFTQQR